MKNLLVLLMSLLLFGTVQGQQNTFSKVLYSNNAGVQGYAITPAFEGGYIIVGENSWNTIDGLVIKVDTSGNLEWNKEYIAVRPPQTQGITFIDITPTNDSCYLLIGSMYNSASHHLDAVLLKITVQGDTVWYKTIAADQDVYLESVYQTNDSGFIVAGQTSSSSLFVAKLDNSGTIQWSKNYDLSISTVIQCSIKQLNDSSFVVVGALNYGGSFLIRLSETGGVVLSKRFFIEGGYGDIMFQDFLTTDSGFVLYGVINTKMFLIQTDSSGNINWAKSYYANNGGGYSNVSHHLKLHNTSDNGYVFVSGNFGGGFIVKSDSVGSVIFSGFIILKPVDVIETENNKFFILGLGPLIGVKNRDVWPPEIGFEQLDSLGGGGECNYSYSVAAVDDTINNESITITETATGYNDTISIDIDSVDITSRFGCVDMSSSVKENSAGNKINIYPNPSSGSFTVSLNNSGSGHFTLFNTLGQKVFEIELLDKHTIIDLSGKFSGIYFYTFAASGKGVAVGKIVISTVR